MGSGVVGQRGSLWFLAGYFGTPAQAITRTLNVPEGKLLFFPVINYVDINTPNIPPQGPENIPVRQLRAECAAFINKVTNVWVKLDGRDIKRVQRVQSEVFDVTLPLDNIFGVTVASNPVYSPAVDDGYYVLIGPLDVGFHVLQFHAENTSQSITQDVTYQLTVVPVARK